MESISRIIRVTLRESGLPVAKGMNSANVETIRQSMHKVAQQVRAESQSEIAELKMQLTRLEGQLMGLSAQAAPTAKEEFEIIVRRADELEGRPYLGSVIRWSEQLNRHVYEIRRQAPGTTHRSTWPTQDAAQSAADDLTKLDPTLTTEIRRVS